MRGVWGVVACDRGNAAMLFALGLVPMLAAAGGGIDYSRAYAIRSKLQAAADAAALAAIAQPNLSKSERVAIAQKTFEPQATALGLPAPPATAEVTESEAVVTASAKVPTTFGGILGVAEVEVDVRSRAVRMDGLPVCALALNPTARGAIRLGGTADLRAPNCVVHANSDSTGALHVFGNAAGNAKLFSAVGGFQGNRFKPEPIPNAPAVKDPFASLPMPKAAGCDYTDIKFKKGVFVAAPGVYCGGIEAQTGATVTFLPGTYVLRDGGFSISSHAMATGLGVTFVLTGTDGVIDIHSGATVTLAAPRTGTYAGLVFVQDRRTSPGETSTIIGGADIKITGAIYVPTQTLKVTGGGGFGVASRALTMIADQLEFSGNGDVNLAIDLALAGYPDNGPKTAGSVRLVH